MSTPPARWLLAWSAAVLLAAASASTAAQREADQPDADFLEFLGSWQTGERQPRWIDPFEIQESPFLQGKEPDRRDSRGRRPDDSDRKPREAGAASSQGQNGSGSASEGVKP